MLVECVYMRKKGNSWECHLRDVNWPRNRLKGQFSEGDKSERNIWAIHHRNILKASLRSIAAEPLSGSFRSFQGKFSFKFPKSSHRSRVGNFPLSSAVILVSLTSQSSGADEHKFLRRYFSKFSSLQETWAECHS